MATGDQLPDYDFRLPLMGLLFVFKTTVQSIPLADKYINLSHTKKKMIQEQTEVSKRVGLVWSG